MILANVFGKNELFLHK